MTVESEAPTLAERVLTAIAEAESPDTEIHTLDCVARIPYGDYRCRCGQMEALKRHCAADRRTVERHSPMREYGTTTIVQSPVCSGCYTGVAEDEHAPWPCPDFLDRAEAYGVTS